MNPADSPSPSAPLPALLRNLSYSSRNEFNSCERKFFLNRATFLPREDNLDTVFGKAVAAGVQELWRSEGNEHRALFAAFVAWTLDFEDGILPAGEPPSSDKKKKNIAYVFEAVSAYFPFYRILCQEWELASIDGVPGVEFSLLLKLPHGFRYRAYVDLILQHRESGQFAVWEVKTSGAKWDAEANYANSDQALSYLLLVDHINPEQAASLWVNYLVYYTNKKEWVVYPFAKSLLDKARFLKTLSIDVQRVRERIADNYFPMRGENCMAFSRPCRYFGACGMSDAALSASPERLLEKLTEEEEKKYSFEIDLEEVLNNYLQTTGDER